ncbi:Tigger transposable element-derived protein 6 [Dictyocoela muelleri]|nr:Tigger transposable element-derived protein 6 [Dictyocoela muelleri]
MKNQKRNVLSLKEKCEILDYINVNPHCKHTKVSDFFTLKYKKNVCRRNIRNFISSEKEIRELFATAPNNKSKVKNMKYDRLDKILIDWIISIETAGAFYSDALIQQKAKEAVTEILNSDVSIEEKNMMSNFKASKGWLQKFKLRHNITSRVCSGERFLQNNVNYEDFKLIFREKMKKYNSNNIFNCDETALFYKLAPSKSLVSKVRNGVKKYKDRLSILFCCNKDGTEKLKPFVIGKFKSPRVFKNFSIKDFCRYKFNQNAWMTIVEFNLWLSDITSDFKKNNRKILLLLDNCTGYKITSKYENIELLFLPKNSTSRLQPLDSGIIRSFKAKFYHHQLSYLVTRIAPMIDIETLYKRITLKDVIIYTAYAWDETTIQKIVNFLEKSLFR